MKTVLAALLAILTATGALAQSSPGLILGQVPTAGQWNSYFSAKQDLLTSNAALTIGSLTLGSLASAGTSCVQVNSAGLLSLAGGACATGSGTVTSISNSDGTITFSPTTGAAVGSIALGHANTWTSTQTFPANSLTLGELPQAGTSTVIGNFSGGTANLTQNTVPSCASDAGHALTNNGGSGFNCTSIVTGTSSVSNSDGSLTFSPTTGNVVGSINVAHTNNWSATQFIAGGGGLGIGETSLIPDVFGDTAFQVAAASGGSDVINISLYANNTNAPYISFTKSRGTTIGQKVAVQGGDNVAYLTGDGYDATTPTPVLREAAYIAMNADASPTTSGVAGNIQLATSGTNGGPAIHFGIDHNGWTYAGNGNDAGVNPNTGFFNGASSNAALAIGWNFSGGAAENDYVNLDFNQANTWSHTFWQMTGTGTSTRLADIGLGGINSDLQTKGYLINGTSIVNETASGHYTQLSDPSGGGQTQILLGQSADPSIWSAATHMYWENGAQNTTWMSLSDTLAGQLKLVDSAASSPGSSGSGTLVLQIGNGSFPGIGINDSGAIGLWSSGSGTNLNIGFAANPTTGLTTVGQFSSTTALHLTPPSSSTNLALLTTQSGHGTVSTNNCNSAFQNYCMNLISVTSNDMAVGGSLGQVNALQITDKVGGSNINGAMIAFFPDLEVTAADNGCSPGVCTSGLYVAEEPMAITNISDGGGSVPATGRGGLWAVNPNAYLETGATNWSIVAGAEVNIAISPGASADSKIGWYVLLPAGDSVQARTGNDAAYAFMNNGSVGFKGGFVASDLFTSKNPLSSGATFLGTQFSAGPYAIGRGLDLTGFTFSGFTIIAGSSTARFAVTPNYDVLANSYNIFQGGTQTNGANCTAGSINAATVTVIGGIITHC